VIARCDALVARLTASDGSTTGRAAGETAGTITVLRSEIARPPLARAVLVAAMAAGRSVPSAITVASWAANRTIDAVSLGVARALGAEVAAPATGSTRLVADVSAERPDSLSAVADPQPNAPERRARNIAQRRVRE
jgi:hypothetical protein